MNEQWVPRCGDRVRLKKTARGKRFGSGIDGRRRWTVAAVKYYANWRQPDIEMTDGDVLNVCWLEPAEAVTA